MAGDSCCATVHHVESLPRSIAIANPHSRWRTLIRLARSPSGGVLALAASVSVA